MQSTDTAVKIPDFRHTDMNRWSKECSEPVIYAYLEYLRGHMLWLETEGKKLLERTEPLSKAEYDLLMKHLGYIVADIPKLKPLKALLQIVIKKGIASLRILAESGKIEEQEGYEYMQAIDFHLTAGAIWGVVSYDCTESEELIDSLVPIAQAWKSKHILERISMRRFPGKKQFLRSLYERHFKNW